MKVFSFFSAFRRNLSIDNFLPFILGFLVFGFLFSDASAHRREHIHNIQKSSSIFSVKCNKNIKNSSHNLWESSLRPQRKSFRKIHNLNRSCLKRNFPPSKDLTYHQCYTNKGYANKSHANYNAKVNLKYSQIVLSLGSNKILSAINPHSLRYPASLTKIMTAYVLFDEIKNRRISLDTCVKISRAAAMQPYSASSGLTEGVIVNLHDLLCFMLARSSNSASYAIAETIGNGNVSNFIQKMNSKAKLLGMNGTRFCNPHGLPDNRQITTAYDMAKLVVSIQNKYPQYMGFFRVRNFVYKDRVFENTSQLLRDYSWVTGFKTGYIGASGYHMITTAKLGKKEVMTIVMGCNSSKERNEKTLNLIYSLK